MSSDLDIISRGILTVISVLDGLGAQEWSLTFVAVGTAVILYGVRTVFGKKRGVDWYAFLHALVSSIGACMCQWLDTFASAKVDGYAEPYRSVALCAEPLTSLHRIMPAITMGYSLLDVLDGLMLSIDFLFHGVATLTIMSLFVVLYQKPQIITPMLLMEVSTTNLTLVRADFFPVWMSLLNQITFAMLFFLFRIVIVPRIMYTLIRTLYEQSATEQYSECFPWSFFPIVVIFCAFFCCLNLFWFYKIARKMKRKLFGHEKINENNHLPGGGVVGGAPGGGNSASSLTKKAACTSGSGGGGSGGAAQSNSSSAGGVTSSINSGNSATSGCMSKKENGKGA